MKLSLPCNLTLLAIALFSGVVLGHYVLDPHHDELSWLAGPDKPPRSGTDSGVASTSGALNHGDVARLSPTEGGARHATADAGAENFHDWFQKYHAAHSDPQRLRDELQAALEQISADEGAASDSAIALDALRRAEQTAGNDYASLVDQADRYLEAYPGSPFADEVREMFAKYSMAWDDHDFDSAREFSREQPDRYEARIARYEEYMERHGAVGQHIADAKRAIESIRSDWAEHEYRVIYEYSRRYPNDLQSVASQVRRFTDEHPSSGRRGAAERFLALYDKAAAPGEYRMRVISGSFSRDIRRAISRGPDLAVEVEVAGHRIGRTPIVSDSFEPVWNYEFPQTVRWRMGDPIKIRVMDFDYSNHVILKVETTDDPVALRYLSGSWEAEGHRLTFECNFETPSLPSPGDHHSL
jgi:hypothetical protein